MTRNLLICFLFSVLPILLLSSCKNQPVVVPSVDNDAVVSAENISNMQVTCFGEDELGFIWAGTSRGVNKYNGYSYLQYYSTGDTTSLSNNYISQIHNDLRGRLWISTRYGVNMHNKQGIFSRIPVDSFSENILQMIESGDNRIFLNTSLDLCEYDEEEKRFVKRISFSENSQLIRWCFLDDKNYLWCVGENTLFCYNSVSFEYIQSYPLTDIPHYAYLRKNGELWLASGSKLALFDIKNSRFITSPASLSGHPLLSGDIITLVHPYDEVSLLINTFKNGLFLYNTYTGVVTHQSESLFPFEVPEMEIISLYTDRHQNLWMGSYGQGFKVCYSYKQRFNANDFLRSQLDQKSVVSVATDKEQNLWIITRMHGLKVWNMKANAIQEIPLEPFFPNDPSYRNRVDALFTDANNAIWLQTNGLLLQCTYRENRLVLHKKFPFNPLINCMTEDVNGRIWAAGTDEYIYYLEKGGDSFERVQLYPKGYNFTNGLIHLSGGKLLAASFAQTMRLIDPETKEISEISPMPEMKLGLFIPSTIYEDSRGDIWIGTIGNGLYRLSLKTRTVESINGIACDEISSIIEDVKGNIWIGTLYGLSKYDVVTNKLISYYETDGIGGNQFNERCVCRLNNGIVVFGGTHGLTVFDPLAVTNQNSFPLFVEELRINNRKVLPEKNGLIETDIMFLPDVILNYNQNNIQLTYAALDYSEFQRVKYAYKLEGFDNFWIEANHHRQAFYSNLPAGHYVFHVKCMSDDNTVEETTSSLRIHVKRAPWLSVPMLCLYMLIIAGIGGYILHLYRRLRKNKERAKLALQEKKQEQHVNQMNMSFFANISHEIRTPLTMISGPISQLYNDPDIKEDKKVLLGIILKNVDRMLRLVNQLMDFNKLENDTLSLYVERLEITHFIQEELEIFRLRAKEKNILLSTFGMDEEFYTWVDADALQKILNNLLSNALKFTAAGGEIDIHFEIISKEEAKKEYPLTEKDQAREYVKISVGDRGPGIPDDKQEDVFKRYYQLDNTDKAFINWGTGIGLYFSRRLVEKHHGYIKVENKPVSGSIFSFVFPVDSNSYLDSEKKKQVTDIITPAVVSPILKIQPDIDLEEQPKADKNTLLVVDDETEISQYLRYLLSADYSVISCFDVQTAWRKIEEVAPDLIISDILMPGVDGITFCRQIKENISTCHIPVILLTAKVTVDDQVEGLNVGANAYVTKPFDPSYLLALVKSQLMNRDNARHILSDTTSPNALSEEFLNAQDMAFMNSLYSLMEAELSNPELNITRMTEMLHISRTKFYYKVKGLTGENPNVFFRTYKLNRAVELIREGKYTMSEIADMTGFSTASHFSSCFKKKFGVSPSEY